MPRFGHNPRFPDEKIPTKAEIEEMYPNPNDMQNEEYGRILGQYFKCANLYLHQFNLSQMMEK